MYYTSILLFHIKVYFIVHRSDKWVVGLMLIWEKDVHKMHLLISPSRRQKYLVHCIYMQIPSHSMWVLHGCKVHTIWKNDTHILCMIGSKIPLIELMGKVFLVCHIIFFLIFFFSSWEVSSRLIYYFFSQFDLI